MPPPHVLRDALLQFSQGPAARPPLEESVVQVLRTVSAGAPDDYCRALLIPFED
jgi:hypothetical protein